MPAGEAGERVPDIVAPPPHHPRFPLSDGARAAAAFAVLVVHVWLFSGGFGGHFGDNVGNRMVVRLDGMVSVFFVLSAFLLYRPMIAHRNGGAKGPRIGTYARGRFLRIYPAYWVAITVLAVVPGLFGVFSSHWPAFYSLAVNLDPLYNSSVCPAGDSFACGLPQSWTLTTEVTFYLALPLYALLAAFLARRGRGWVGRELVLLAALAGLSVFLNMSPFSLREQPWFRFTLLGHFLWLALGLAFAVVSVGYRERSALPRPLRFLTERPAVCWLAALAIYGITVATLKPVPFIVAEDTSGQFLATHLAHAALATLILIPVLLGDPNRGLPRRALANPVIAWVGLVSYGLYLWHVTIAYYLGFGGADLSFPGLLLLTLVIALPLAALSYYLLERPLMKLKRRPLGSILARSGS